MPPSSASQVVRVRRPGQPAFGCEAVRCAFDSYAPGVRERLLELRSLIFAVAASTPDVGELTETLKWGQPSYLTLQSRSGSTVRLGPARGDGSDYAIYFHCQTTLVGDFRAMFGDTLRYQGNRAIVFRVDDPLPISELRQCLAMALLYHRHRTDGRGRARRTPT